MFKRHNKKNWIVAVLFIILICTTLTYVNSRIGDNKAIKGIPIINPLLEVKKTTTSTTTTNIKKEDEYNKCINKRYTKEDITPDIKKLMNKIDKTIKNKGYDVSILYEDINTGFQYTYKENRIFYGCSLVKLVDALYLLDEANKGTVDLDKETITYTKKFKHRYSIAFEDVPYGTKVSLRDLIKYAIRVSDNSAHLMLINYIGKNNLKNYAYNLGAKEILSRDLYGNQSVLDTNIYLKESYRIITEDKTYGPFLKSIMDNNYYNRLSTDDIKIYHKYGACQNEFNDIGLYLDDNPYAISIFTKHYNGNKAIIKDLHELIINLHKEYHKNRENTCKTLVYE